MRRMLLLLPLCLVLAPESPRRPPPLFDSVPIVRGKVSSRDNAQMEALAATDPVAFLEACVARYDREISAYRVKLIKQERIKGKLLSSERIQASFREKPFSVLMEWEQGARLAFRTLYVEGENNNKLLVKPAGWRAVIGVTTSDPESDDAKASARFPATHFGVGLTARRTLKFWKAAQKRGELKIVFKGLQEVPELGITCWVLERSEYAEPEDDGITSGTFYFDPATWAQVGSVVRGPGGELIGSYFFRDLVPVAEHPKDTFTLAAVKR